MSAGVRLLCEDEVMVLMLNKEADVMELMTLDEHIKKAEEDAENCRQLVEWLKDYKRLLAKESGVDIRCGNCKHDGEGSGLCDKCWDDVRRPKWEAVE